MQNEIEEIKKEYKGKITIFETSEGGGNPMQGFDYPYEKDITEDFMQKLNTKLQQSNEEYAKMGFKDGQQSIARKVLNGCFWNDGAKYPHIENHLYKELEDMAGIKTIRDENEQSEEQFKAKRSKGYEFITANGTDEEDRLKDDFEQFKSKKGEEDE